jgi:hypothetical protein
MPVLHLDFSKNQSKPIKEESKKPPSKKTMKEEDGIKLPLHKASYSELGQPHE